MLCILSTTVFLPRTAASPGPLTRSMLFRFGTQKYATVLIFLFPKVLLALQSPVSRSDMWCFCPQVSVDHNTGTCIGLPDGWSATLGGNDVADAARAAQDYVERLPEENSSTPDRPDQQIFGTSNPLRGRHFLHGGREQRNWSMRERYESAARLAADQPQPVHNTTGGGKQAHAQHHAGTAYKSRLRQPVLFDRRPLAGSPTASLPTSSPRIALTPTAAEANQHLDWRVASTSPSRATAAALEPTPATSPQSERQLVESPPPQSWAPTPTTVDAVSSSGAFLADPVPTDSAAATMSLSEMPAATPVPAPALHTQFVLFCDLEHYLTGCYCSCTVL